MAAIGGINYHLLVLTIFLDVTFFPFYKIIFQNIVQLACNKFNIVLRGTFSHENKFCNINNK